MLNELQSGAVKLVLWRHWMHATEVHPVTAENQLYCPSCTSVCMYDAACTISMATQEHTVWGSPASLTVISTKNTYRCISYVFSWRLFGVCLLLRICAPKSFSQELLSLKMKSKRTQFRSATKYIRLFNIKLVLMCHQVEPPCIVHNILFRCTNVLRECCHHIYVYK